MTLAMKCQSSMVCFLHSQVTPAFVKDFEMWNACYRTPFQAYSCSCFLCHCGELGDNHKGPRHLQEIHRSKIPTTHTYFWVFQLFWKQRLFLFLAGQYGVPRDFAKRQRPNHGDQDEENDWKPQVSEMHISGQEIRHIKKEFCHHATETVLEVRRVHCHFTPSLGFS